MTPLSYSATLSGMLRQYAEARNWEGLKRYLAMLSHSQFRAAGNLLSEETLPALSGNDFWECFLCIVPTHTKAYLTTFLKAAKRLYSDKRLEIDKESFEKFGRWVHGQERTIDEKKTVEALLPIVRTPGEVNLLFEIFGVEDIRKKVAYLMPCDGVTTYYALFQCFRHLDHYPELLSAYCNRLMAKGDDRAFNLVSIMKCYFGLPSVKGHFSLKLSAYELSRLDASFEDFKSIICRI